MNRALVIAYHFPPDSSIGTYRTLKFVKYLREYGWECVVVTVNPKYEPLEPKDQELLNEVPPTTVVLRTGSISPLQASSRLVRGILKWLSFPDRQGGWFPFALWNAWRAVQQYRPAVIYTTAPPFTGSLVGLALTYLTKIPLISDFRDPWVGDHYVRRYSPWRQRLVRWLEHRIFLRSARVINVSDVLSARAWERARELPPDRFVVINNGFDPDDFQPVPAYNRGSEFRITYTGTFYPGTREPRAFLNAMAWVARHHPEEFRDLIVTFVGDTEWADRNAAWLAELGLGEHIRFLPFQPHRVATRLLGESDLLLLFGSFQKTDQGTLTGKLMEYLAAGRPILALSYEGELSQVVRESGIGCVVAPDNPEAIAAVLVEMMRSIQAGRFSTEPNVDLLRRFDRRTLTGQLAAVFDAATVM